MLDFLILHPKTFGLDISDFSLKIAQLEKRKRGFQLTSFNEAEIDKGVVVDGEIKKEDRLAEIIRTALQDIKGKPIRTKYVAVSLPEEKAFLQIVQLPKMKEQEIDQAIRFEAENYIPYSIDTVYLDHAIVSPLQNSLDHIDVLLASLPRVIVDSYVSVIKKAGLIPKILEVESLSLTRAVVEKETSPIPLLIVDIGSVRTKLSIYSGHSVRFTTSIPISSGQFTDAIAKALHIDKKKAEELKKAHGIDSKEESPGKEVFEALIPALTDFVEQVNKYMEYYETHIPHQHLRSVERKIKRIILCGGGVNLRGLPEFLMRELKTGVVIGNPWINILSPDSKEIPPLAFQDSLRYTTALGLALRGVKD